MNTMKIMLVLPLVYTGDGIETVESKKITERFLKKFKEALFEGENFKNGAYVTADGKAKLAFYADVKFSNSTEAKRIVERLKACFPKEKLFFLLEQHLFCQNTLPASVCNFLVDRTNKENKKLLMKSVQLEEDLQYLLVGIRRSMGLSYDLMIFEDGQNFSVWSVLMTVKMYNSLAMKQCFTEVCRTNGYKDIQFYSLYVNE